MPWIARLLLFIPSLVASWFVTEDDFSFWIVALAIGLLLVAASSTLLLYVPWLRDWWRERQ